MIHQGDCFDIFPEIKEKINLVLVDLPYGITECEWDKKLDLDRMWIELKKICLNTTIYVFFCTTKFGYEIIQSNPKWFKYDLVWQKSKSVGFLNANKAPLRSHEMIYIFACPYINDIDRNKNIEIRKYAEQVKKYINKSATKAHITNTLGSYGYISHFFGHNGIQFSLPIKKIYNKLIEEYNIDKMEGYIEYDELKEKWESLTRELTYNPQKTKGEPYKCKRKGNRSTLYGKFKNVDTENKGDRHPTSILSFSAPKKYVHSTQKPVELCEWLINTYSNENDLVLDFCMGSGSTGVACKNTNRRFIGIEKDPEIFKVAKKRF